MTKTRFPKAGLLLKRHKQGSRAKDKEEGLSSSTRRTQNHDDSFSIEYHNRQQEEECLRNLQEQCRLANISVSDNIILRFACYYDFDYNFARTAIAEKYDDPYLHLRMDVKLKRQFEYLVMYPLPGLKTKNMKHEVLYFRSCRHLPGEMDTELLIKNVCYVFNHMSMTEEQCRNGVALMVDLDQWTLKNFSPEIANKLLKAIQHQVPTKVATILIVNGPSWFPKVYRCVFKKMLTSSFAKKQHFLKHPQQLRDHLMDGYEKYLPSEMSCGWQDSSEIVEDFIDQHVYDESSN